MRKTPFKYIEKAVQTRLAEVKQIIRSQYGSISVPKTKIEYTVKPHRYLAYCQLDFDEDLFDDFDPFEKETYDATYKSYGVWNITLNTYLLNDLKLPYVHNVMGHEFAHACVGHIISMKSLIYKCGSKEKKPYPHGPEFKKFCRLFNVAPEMSNAKGSVGRTSAKWNRTNGRPYKMWCCCDEFFVSKAEYDRSMENVYECPSCDEVMLPYGMENHPLEIEEKIT